MKLTQIFKLSLVVFLTLSASGFCALTKRVVINQIVEHPALNAVRSGIQDALNQTGFEPNFSLNVSTECAHGNMTTAAQIAQKIAGLRPDVAVAISTPSTQTLIQTAQGAFPIIFAAVTDSTAVLPQKSKSAHLNVTGVTDHPPFAQQLELIEKIIGSNKRLGVLYNTGEANSVAAVAEIKSLISTTTLTLVEAQAVRSTDMSTCATDLTQKTDAILIPNDNTAVSSLDVILKICNQAKIPVFSTDPILVERGVVAAVGYDYYAIGQQVGHIVAQILQGKNTADFVIKSPDQPQKIINQTAASKLGLQLSQDVLKQASRIF